MTSHEVCNNRLHVWTVDARDKVEPQQEGRLPIFTHFCVVLAVGHFSLSSTFDQFISKERQLALLHQIYQLHISMPHTAVQIPLLCTITIII